MTDIFQLTYISTAIPDIDIATCDDILRSARETNARRDVTGLLLFNSKRFVQVLEGREADVRAIYAEIENDPRHYGLVVIGENYRTEREFGSWSMAFDNGSGTDGALPDKVTALLEKAGPSTRSLFQTSAKLYRNNYSLD
jgi:hypothetical protein